MNTTLIDKARQGRLAALVYRGRIGEAPQLSGLRHAMRDIDAGTEAMSRAAGPTGNGRPRLVLMNFS